MWQRYVWDKSQMEVTLTTELNMVCGEQYKRRLLSSVLMIGEKKPAISMHSDVGSA